jgi:phage gpG-like protein
MKIPARPFLGLTEKEIQEVVAAVERYEDI